MFDLFTIREQFYLQKQEILIKKDENNLIKIFTNQSFSAVDLDNYLGLLQIANSDLNNKLYTNNQAKGDLLENIKISLDFKELSNIINQAGDYIEGGSHILS